MYFDKKYFERETICGFEVSSMMKRAWAAQLEVLQVVIDICNRNDIIYYAAWGTMLGAVRHQGFIPWDDDIDIHLKRNDYKKLIEVLADQLPEGFCVRGIHSKMPSGNEIVDTLYQIYVVAERPSWDRYEYMKYFHGYPFDYVGIDIFPLDFAPRDKESYDVQKLLLNIALYLYWNWDELNKTGELHEGLIQFEEVSGVPLPKDGQRVHMVKMMDAVASLYQEYESDHLMEYISSNCINNPMLKKEWYDETILMPFENIEIAVPAEYDKILRTWYGDYQQFVRGSAAHGYPYYEEMEQSIERELIREGVNYSVDEFCEMVLNGEIKFV